MSNKTLIIFLNGAPRTGKDTTANRIGNLLFHKSKIIVHQKKFAAPLKTSVHAICGRVFDENEKDSTFKDYNNRTPRELYIALSEQFIKPMLGHKFFGDHLVKSLDADIEMLSKYHEPDEQPNRICIISDSGFQEEALPVVERYGDGNCLLVNLKRDGCTFAGDSRSEIKLHGVETISLDNNGTIKQLDETINEGIFQWLRNQLPNCKF